MRLSSKKSKILLMIIVTAIVWLIGKSVYGSTTVYSSDNKNLSIKSPEAEAYLNDAYLFCIDHLRSYWIENVSGMDASSREIDYSYNKDIKLEQSVAFAIYTAIQTNNWDEEAIQQIIWASDQYKDSEKFQGMLLDYAVKDSNNTLKSKLQARAEQYAQFYYGILNKDGKIEFSSTSDKCRVLVDSVNDYYTVGPYKLDVKTTGLDSTPEAKTIFYNELARINEYSDIVPFASFEITGIDGTSIKILDKNGKEIQFPGFGKEFYIRFKPNQGVTKINPGIGIKYIKEVDGTGSVYIGSKGTVEGYINDVNLRLEVSDNFDPANIPGNIFDEQFGMALTGTLTDKGNEFASMDLKIINCEVTDGTDSWEDPIYDSNGRITGYQHHYYYVKSFKYKAEIEIPTRLQELIKIGIEASADAGIRAEWKDEGEVKVAVVAKEDYGSPLMGAKSFLMELGGNVWQDLGEVKTLIISGVRSANDTPFAGMEVRLYDENNNLVATTITDANGKYHFSNLNPLIKYYVKFVYNGQLYQTTYYKNNLTGGYSNGQDISRDSFNSRFGKIDSTPKNYKINGQWHKSYGLQTKLARDNGEYIENGKDNEGKIIALTYGDAWNQFLKYVVSQGSYDKAYTELTKWLQSKGVGSVDCAGVVTFIKDCMIEATTHVDDPLTSGTSLVQYPVYDRFVLEDLNNPPDNVETVTFGQGEVYSYLYTKKSDQSRYVDFGITERENEEVKLEKDVYKATVIVNGKSQEYKYAKKDANNDGTWNIEVRAADELYNGAYAYSREVRPSEYLYNDESTPAKNIQVYVTYRIIVLNASPTLDASINEIVDYYDADQYTFDGTLNANGTYTLNTYNRYDENGNVTETYVNSFIGDKKGNKLPNSNLVVSNKTSFADREANKTLSNGNYNYSSLYITGIKSASGSDRLTPGETVTMYLTFKVNNDPATGKVKLDQDLNAGTVTVGKRNIAEINGYSTYYGPNASIPNYLQQNNGRVDASVSGKTAGIIATQSKAGSLQAVDLTNEGDLRSSTTSQVENRLETDTDKAPNIKVIIKNTENDSRILSGYVYEDERNVTNDKAVVGNGKHEDGETLINGVKVELVELVQNVDNNGIFLGNYIGEKVWGTTTFDYDGNGQLVKVSENNDRYFSGIGSSKVILTGPGIFHVSSDNIGNNGTYAFKSVPAGDFYIRFTYGDHEDTVLLNNENSVNTLIGKKGLNAKSYNGQDYKSTTYQTEINQDTSYNGIRGYKDYESQNENNWSNKSSMYYYDIGASANVQGASDAKDVYSYREKVNNWSMGANDKTLLNNRAEILDSFESLGTYEYSSIEEQRKAQEEKINQLKQNTAMVAETGIIDTEIEYNTRATENQGNNNKIDYTIGDIDLGLQERPKAQLKLNKEITNFKLILANRQPLFDTTQSVNNLFFAQHNGHSVKYNGFRLDGYEVARNSKELPELIQAYMDEELIAGATIEATYDISVQNVGEVDYLDKQFYYTGKSLYPNDAGKVSTTNAKEIIDYVSNLARFDENYQDVDSNWKVTNAQDIIKSSTLQDNGELLVDESKLDSDLVNRAYLPQASTYNTMITTDKLSSELLPALFDEDNSTSSTKLVISALLSNTGEGNFVYNNLAEIVATSNSQGRKMAYSISGNQEMSDQSLGDDASEEIYTTIDLVTPSEIDADSSQKIVILPPTGENRNYVLVIMLAAAAIMILVAGVLFIKKII